MASSLMVAWWGVRRAGPLGRWWAVTASWLGSCCCWMMPWRVAAVWCCARVRQGSGRPGWRRRPPRRPPRGACRWRGPGRPTGTACRRTACGGSRWMSPPSGRPMMTLPGWACGRASSVTPNARRRLMAPIPAATSGSRCSRRFAGGWRRRPGRAGCCWCSMICSGRTRRRRSCSQMSCANCEGRSSWCWRPTGSRRHPMMIRAPGCCCARSADANTERLDLRGLAAGEVGSILARRRAVGVGGSGPPGVLRNGRQPVPGPRAGPHARRAAARRAGAGAGTGGGGDGPPARATVGSPPGRWCRPPPWQATASRPA